MGKKCSRRIGFRSTIPQGNVEKPFLGTHVTGQDPALETVEGSDSVSAPCGRDGEAFGAISVTIFDQFQIT